MESIIKWRPMWNVWFPFVLFLIPLILEDQMAGTLFTPYLYGLLLLIYGFIYYARTRLWQVPVLALTTALALWIYFLTERPWTTIETIRLAGIPAGDGLYDALDQYFSLPVWFVFLLISFVSFITAGRVFVRALDLEGSAIKLFKITAKQIQGEQNGYTERPFIAGKHNYDDNQLWGFASFLESKKVVVAEYPDGGVKLKFSMGISPLNKKYSDKVSYVLFDNEGTLSVFISQNDYSQYRKQYTFDQLCARMGNTFLRFADYVALNQEKRILTELKNA